MCINALERIALFQELHEVLCDICVQLQCRPALMAPRSPHLCCLTLPTQGFGAPHAKLCLPGKECASSHPPSAKPFVCCGLRTDALAHHTCSASSLWPSPLMPWSRIT